MKTFHFRNLHNRVGACIQAHPVETALGIAFFLLYLFSQQQVHIPSLSSQT
jgi:hypothetical protein